MLLYVLYIRYLPDAFIIVPSTSWFVSLFNKLYDKPAHGNTRGTGGTAEVNPVQTPVINLR